MKATENIRSLQDLVTNVPDLVTYFRNATSAPHSRNRPGASPVPAEFSNWREEQQAWRETAVLFDQSHHMPELLLKGPDSLKLLSRLGINNFSNFGLNRAKQFIGCNFEGRVIGESVLHYLAPDHFQLISGMHLQDWVQFNAETGGYDVAVTRDYQTSQNSTGRANFRLSLDGPNAGAIFEEVVEGVAPEIPFFRTAKVKVAGCEVLALRHSMAGHKGVEFSGPYVNGPAVRAELMRVGQKYGLKPAGRLSYFSTPSEGGWLAYPLPALYTDPNLKAFREWLPATAWAANVQLGGSYVAEDISKYYLTPYDMGLGHLVKFDHDFVGRDELERISDQPHRSKVTLVWDKDDVARIQRSVFEPGLPFRYLELPVASYGFPQADEIRSSGGDLVGMAGFSGISFNEKEMLSIAVIDQPYAEPGTKVTLIWGEPDGATSKPGKPHVERHRQIEVRATVAAAPFAATVRKVKKAGIGQAAA